MSTTSCWPSEISPRQDTRPKRTNYSVSKRYGSSLGCMRSWNGYLGSGRTTAGR